MSQCSTVARIEGTNRIDSCQLTQAAPTVKRDRVPSFFTASDLNMPFVALQHLASSISLFMPCFAYDYQYTFTSGFPLFVTTGCCLLLVPLIALRQECVKYYNSSPALCWTVAMADVMTSSKSLPMVPKCSTPRSVYKHNIPSCTCKYTTRLQL